MSRIGVKPETYNECNAEINLALLKGLSVLEPSLETK